MPFFEPRLPPLPCTTLEFKEEEEAQHLRTLPRSKSYPGYLSYELVVAEPRQQQAQGSAEKPRDEKSVAKKGAATRNCVELASEPPSPYRPMQLWPDTDEEEGDEESPNENFWQPLPASLSQEDPMQFLEMQCPTQSPTRFAVVEMQSLMQPQECSNFTPMECQENTAWLAEDVCFATTPAFTGQAMLCRTPYTQEAVQERLPVVLPLEALIGSPGAIPAGRPATSLASNSPMPPRAQQKAFDAGPGFFPEQSLVTDTSECNTKSMAKQKMHQLQRAAVEPGLCSNVAKARAQGGTVSPQDALAQARSTGMNALKKARALMPATNMKPLRLVDPGEPKPSTQQQPPVPTQPGPTLLGRENQLKGMVDKKSGKFMEAVPKKGAMPFTALSQSVS